MAHCDVVYPTQNVSLSTVVHHFLMASIITINMIIIKLFLASEMKKGDMFVSESFF